ncbi:MAG: response regulator [Patescibacteria group bacterium]
MEQKNFKKNASPKPQTKILIAEDEIATRKVLADTLRQSGFKVFEAEDGEQALIVALKEHPDLILLDIIMPKLDGLGVLEKLREDPWGKKATLILLTNMKDSESISKALKYNVTEYFTKSDWELAEIVEKVKSKLNLN